MKKILTKVVSTTDADGNIKVSFIKILLIVLTAAAMAVVTSLDKTGTLAPVVQSLSDVVDSITIGL